MGSCGICEAETPSTITLCHNHTTRLEQHLAEVDSVWDDLRITVARLDHTGPTVGGGTSGPRDQVNWDASEKATQLARVLTGWAEVYGHPTPDPIRASRILFTGLRDIRKQDWAADLLDELQDAMRDARNAMDRPQARVFAGMCPTSHEGKVCGTPLYARQGSLAVNCRTCGAQWDVTDWRARALIAAGLHHGTPAEVSRMLTDPITGDALPSGTIRQWINRGKLTPIAHNTKGKPLYQVRKVRNLWTRSLEARHARIAA
jgi:hypothetical protein